MGNFFRVGKFDIIDLSDALAVFYDEKFGKLIVYHKYSDKDYRIYGTSEELKKSFEMICEKLTGDKHQGEMITTVIENDIMLMPILNYLEPSVRTMNCLKCAGIHFVGDLISKNKYELLRIDGLGKKTLYEIKELLAMRGLELSK